jgi:hypothetical protein
MPQFGGKDSKRHFTVVMGNKEHGLYISSTPSSAARKAVTKLCAANKSKKVEFSIREITQGSKKKTYGPYEGYIEKLKEPIELKGRVIRYKPVAKLSGKKGVQKGGYIENIISTDYTSYDGIINGLNKLTPEQKEILGFRYSDTAEAFIKDKECYMWRLKINNHLPYYIILKINSFGSSSIYIAFYLEEPKPAAEENPKTTILAIGKDKNNFLDNLRRSEKNNELRNLIKYSEKYYTSDDKYAMTHSQFYRLKFEVTGSTE